MGIAAFRNEGGDATGLVITDALPAEFTLLTSTASVAVTQTGANPLQWAAGDSGVIILVGQADSALGLTVFTNTARITSATPDTGPGNNLAQAAITGCGSDIEVQNGNATGPGSLYYAIAAACDGATITFANNMTVTIIYTAGTGTNFNFINRR